MNLNSVSPIAASVEGGVSITLTGSNFQSGAKVYFGSEESPSVTLKSPTELTAVLPSAADTGIVSVTVVNPDDSNDTLYDSFTNVSLESDNTEVFGISPMTIFEDTATTLTLRGRHLIESYNNGVLALRGPAGISIQATNITMDVIDDIGTEEVVFSVQVTSSQPLEPDERLAIQIMASRRPGAQTDGIVETSRKMFTVLPNNVPVPIAYTSEIKPDKPTAIVVLGRNLEDCTIDFGSGPIVHTQLSRQNLISGVVTVPESALISGKVEMQILDIGGVSLGTYDLVESSGSNLAGNEIDMNFAPMPGQKFNAATENDTTVYNLNGQNLIPFPFDWTNFEITILDITIILPIINEVYLIPFFDGGGEYESPVRAEVGKLLRLRGMGLVIAARVEITVHIRVVLIIGIIFTPWPFGLYNEFPQYSYALGTVVIGVRVEIEFIITIAFMIALVEPTGNLRVLLAIGLTIGIDFTIDGNGNLRFEPEFTHSVYFIGISPDIGPSQCGGKFILATDEGQSVFLDSFGGHRSYYLPRIPNDQCCLTWNFNLQLLRFRQGGSSEIIQDVFQTAFCLTAFSPSSNLYRIYISSTPSPVGVPPTLEMDLGDLAQLVVLAEPVDSNGNPTGPAIDIRSLDYDVEFFLEHLLPVLNPATLPDGIAHAVLFGENLIKAAVTSVRVLDDEQVIGFYPDSIAGFKILRFLAADEEPRLVPEGLPVAVNELVGAITITPKLAYLDGKTPVDAGGIMVRSEPFESRPKKYVLAVKIQGIDFGTPEQEITCTVVDNPNNPKIKVVKNLNGVDVEVTEPPLENNTGKAFPFANNRPTETSPAKFFSGSLSTRGSTGTIEIDSTTPNNQLIAFEDLEVWPHNLEEVVIQSNPPNIIITKLVPPGHDVLDKHIELHLNLEFKSSEPLSQNTQLKIRVQNQENFEEYLRVFNEAQSDLSNNGNPGSVLNNSKLDGTLLKTFDSDFAAFLETTFAGGEPSDSALLTWGSNLWAQARDFVQTDMTPGSSYVDDRILYYIRLNCLVALKAYYKRHSLGNLSDPKRKLFELASRGFASNGTSIDVPGDLKKVIVTGFDPFVLPSMPTRNNSSGLAALSLDSRAFSPAGAEQYYVKTAILPVRYKEFSEGLIEVVTTNSIAPIAMLITTSLHPQQLGLQPPAVDVFDVERFATSYRLTDFADNMNIHLKSPGNILPGPFYLQTTLPHSKVITSASQTQEIPGPNSPPPAQFVLDQEYRIRGFFPPHDWQNVPGKYRYRSFEGTDEAWNLKETPDAGTVVEVGSGGNFLSNEIMYRTALARQNAKPTLASGHIHVPPSLPPLVNNLGVGLIEGITEAVKRLAKYAYLVPIAEEFEFLQTVVNSSRDLEVVFSNPVGNNPLEVASVEVDAQSPFTLVSPTLPTTIDPNDSETFVFRFSPVSTGDFSTEIKFKEGGGQALALTRLIGRGVTVLPLPTITMFTPHSGPPYTPIFVQGTNFINVLEVQIGGNAAWYNVFSETELYLFGTEGGFIGVVTPYGQVQSSLPFIVTGRGQ